MVDATNTPKGASSSDKDEAGSPLRSKTASPVGRVSSESAREEARATEIEVDEASLDDASTINSRISSYTASLSSSVLDYPTENGRRYHAFRAGAYYAPNDEREMDRLDFNHMLMCKLAGGPTGPKLFLAPIETEKIKNILDIGTGTGVWSIEAAEVFPNAKITGNDLSAIQPSWVPPNVQFEIDDVESPWANSAKYDFIYCRYMLGCISDWPKLVSNAYENLEEDGWVEFQDYDLTHYSDDGTLTADHETLKWANGFIRACDTIGRDARPGSKLETWIRDAGFVDVVHHVRKLPIGPWAKDPHYKDLGMIQLIQLLEGMEAFTLRLFCDVLGWTREECLVMLSTVRNELKSNEFHAQMDLHVVYARKPVSKK
ncbi:Secondary metabolism regulator LAE1 [Colletotrichum orbiculare MAFF 240422]|uniref:Secondary metabolism regulator LAE1 n=1 Tax=Colletotrichum orbiculare (strain 104-T / ATCC 96160 / CBS 514.97 / LARS 414 / MAFF 240422) TaxID=1213857 RepID=A0A484FJI0_COLOR|nr:Secondary metabolism regulator LAE1 [Colletotrichum orbiculare MAFF 240422]